MSAPEVSIDKQKRRHRVPLIGMAVGIIFVVTLIIYWPSEEATPTLPQGTGSQLEGQGPTPPETGTAPAGTPGSTSATNTQ